MKIGLLGAMFLIFLTLKLCGVIAWSWWLVTSPLWIVPAFWLAMAFISIVLAALIAPSKRK